MSQKQQNQSDFNNDDVKQFIIVNEQAHYNWMSGLPLIEGNEAYAKSHPEDWERLTNAYERMNQALGNPPIKSSRCCGGGCGCHGE